MIYKKSTEYGSIGFTKKTIGKVIMQCVDEAPMKIVISNKKGKMAGFAHVMGGNDDVDNIGIEIDDGEIYLELFILIPFGTSIKRAKQYLNDSIKEKMVFYFRTVPFEVRINLVGMLTRSGKVKY